MTAQVIEHTTSFLVQPPRITSQQSLFASHLSHLNKDYIKETAKPSLRADAPSAPPPLTGRIALFVYFFRDVRQRRYFLLNNRAVSEGGRIFTFFAAVCKLLAFFVDSARGWRAHAHWHHNTKSEQREIEVGRGVGLAVGDPCSTVGSSSGRRVEATEGGSRGVEATEGGWGA